MSDWCEPSENFSQGNRKTDAYTRISLCAVYYTDALMSKRLS